tara:strand:- start:177 stop:281 length:105 start_codon:yes stop_codon:yes gene_type:complete
LISIDENELQYPIVIEMPADYWTYSINISEENEE